MLGEVRKEAFTTRYQKSEKSSSTNNVLDDDEEDADEPSSISSGLSISEAWTTWYPQEWIGWVMYGVSSEKPTEHWVNQPISDGPTESDNYVTDENGLKSSRRPPGRTSQREKVTMESSVAKQNSDANSMRAQHLLQVDEELEMNRSARDLQVIDNLSRTATTEAQKVGGCVNFITVNVKF